MADHEYRFRTRWIVPHGVDEVYGVLAEPRALPRWWPAVYLAVEELEHGDPDGVGRVVSFFTKGWAPYTLRWQARVVAVRAPFEMRFEASGDLVGTGHWQLQPQGDATEVVFDWAIAAEKPLLKHLSPLLRPAFAANHAWAMRRGEESLRLELARRAEADPEARARIPAPPAPTPSSPLPALLGGVGAVALAAGSALLLRRPRR